MFTFYLLDKNSTNRFLWDFSHFWFSCHRLVAYKTVCILFSFSENSPFEVYKVFRWFHFCVNGLVLRMGIWQVHFIAFLMWWIREFEEGKFIPCNTAQLISKCPSKNACYILVKEHKNKNLLLALKKLLLIAVVVFKKAKCTCLICEKLQPKCQWNLL